MAGSEVSLALHFADSVEATARKRVEHAWRNFLAFYGYRQAMAGETPTKVVRYGEDIPALYAVRPENPLSFAQWQGESIPLRFGLAADGRPDWLGEVFTWLTSEDERSGTAHDSLGRVDAPVTKGLLAEKPYATLLMVWLEAHLFQRTVPQRPRSPFPDAEHVVVCSHDIDYYWTGFRDAAKRLVKNAAIAILQLRDRRFFFDSFGESWRLLRGDRTGDLAQALADAGKKHDFRSSVFVITRHSHRRDANYRLSDIAPRLAPLRDADFSFELHGSYCSLVEEGDLAKDVAEFRHVFGSAPSGGRQHWLRYDHPDRLFAAVERAQLSFDSSVGFVDRPGFRSGASFPFVPYDFSQEAAFRFVEIPLAVMDGSLVEAAVRAPAEAERVCEAVLSESRRWGWGGISVLWHNPIRPLAVASPVNDLFWQLLARRRVRREKWVSGADLCRAMRSRFAAAGLEVR